MSGILGGGGSGTNTVVQNSQPPAYLQPYLEDAAKKAQEAQQSFSTQNLNQPYAGPRTAGPTTSDTLSQQIASQVAQQAAPNAAVTQKLGTDIAGNVSNGTYTAPSNIAFNPLSGDDLTAAIKAQITPMQQQFSEKTLPQMNSAAINAGAYGGSKWSQTNEQASRDEQQTENNAIAQAVYGNQQATNQLNLQNTANLRSTALQGNQQNITASGIVPTLLSDAEQQGLDVSNIYSQVGSQQRGFTTADINAAMQKYVEQQQSPFMGLGDYEGLLSGASTPGSGIKSSATSAPSSSFGNLAAGALGTAGLANAIFGGGGLSGIGSMIGSMGGGFEGILNSMGIPAGLQAAAPAVFL